jgi:hypothetical protein
MLNMVNDFGFLKNTFINCSEDKLQVGGSSFDSQKEQGIIFFHRVQSAAGAHTALLPLTCFERYFSECSRSN